MTKTKEAWQSYCKEREMEYRAVLAEWLRDRHKVAQGFVIRAYNYCYEVIANIRAYGEGAQGLEINWQKWTKKWLARKFRGIATKAITNGGKQ
ncbi:hypothetical protein V3I05_07795 [Helicobacter mastomyrinus]|uniref:Uncharacterized protein n=1 Tax=Helicobacter mastomyrinus TaxID=287948 RepID=A0ABZ3F623_9HELI